VENWFLYVIRCKGGSLYTGITTDVQRRIKEHQSSDGKGAKYLRGKAPVKLIFRKKIGSRRAALMMENRVKKLTKAKKEMFVAGKISIGEIK
jgi:putative endonuclease